jgi:hypothetical protein
MRGIIEPNRFLGAMLISDLSAKSVFDGCKKRGGELEKLIPIWNNHCDKLVAYFPPMLV